MATWKKGAYEHWIGLYLLDAESGQGIENIDYEIHFLDGEVVRGTLDEAGKALHENRQLKPVERIEYIFPPGPDEKPHPPLDLLLSELQKEKGGAR
ncbi:hypothetical protein D3C81_1865440 [compost metagenome]